MEMDIDEIRENYKRFENDRIKRIAKNDARSLKQDSVPVLIEEIKKRGLSNRLIDWVNAERRRLSAEELADLKMKTKKCKCQLCKKNTDLKGFKFMASTGIIIDHSTYCYKLIVCAKCGRKKQKSALISTMVFGWWSLYGLLCTPIIIFNTIKAQFQKDVRSEKLIEDFIKSNIGHITLGKETKEVLEELIKRFNTLDEFGGLDAEPR